MHKIEHDGQLYAMLVQPEKDAPNVQGTVWIGDPHASLQGSLMYYHEQKKFKTHRHILNPRLINKTQECFVVIRGRIEVNVELPGEGLWLLQAGPGEAIFVWGGYHGLKILEDDTLLYELKAGSFTSVADDKEFLG